MKTHSLRDVAAIFLVLVLMLAVSVSAFAEGGSSSATNEATVNGYTYSYYSLVYAGVYNGVPYANASVSIRTKPSGTNVPAGWMYAQGRLYAHSGT